MNGSVVRVSCVIGAVLALSACGGGQGSSEVSAAATAEQSVASTSTSTRSGAASGSSQATTASASGSTAPSSSSPASAAPVNSTPGSAPSSASGGAPSSAPSAAPATSVNVASFAGVWDGTIYPDGVIADGASNSGTSPLQIVDHNGDLYTIVRYSDPGCAQVFVSNAPLVASGNFASAQASNGAVYIELGNPGGPSNTSCVNDSPTLTLTPVSSTQYQMTASNSAALYVWNQDGTSLNGASLATLTGGWNSAIAGDPGGGAWSFNADGTFNGVLTNNIGCEIAGTVTVQDPTINVYSFTGTLSNCNGSVSPTLNGLTGSGVASIIGTGSNGSPTPAPRLTVVARFTDRNGVNYFVYGTLVQNP